jgi:hypothetical protein
MQARFCLPGGQTLGRADSPPEMLGQVLVTRNGVPLIRWSPQRLHQLGRDARVYLPMPGAEHRAAAALSVGHGEEELAQWSALKWALNERSPTLTLETAWAQAASLKPPGTDLSDEEYLEGAFKTPAAPEVLIIEMAPAQATDARARLMRMKASATAAVTSEGG